MYVSVYWSVYFRVGADASGGVRVTGGCKLSSSSVRAGSTEPSFQSLEEIFLMTYFYFLCIDVFLHVYLM